MPKYLIKMIAEIDPTADPERVGDIADANFRSFGEMTREQWVACVRASKA